MRVVVESEGLGVGVWVGDFVGILLRDGEFVVVEGGVLVEIVRDGLGVLGVEVGVGFFGGGGV